MAKIAIIDDDPDIVEATTILLESKGYTVVSAGNVDEALVLIDTEKPDLLILDVMMVEPDDGFFLANKIRKKGNQTPILMLTSVSKALGFKFDGSDVLPVQEFLEKPVPPSLLLDKVIYHLEHTKGN